MKQVEKSGKTVEEAVEAALAELQVTRDQVEVQVLEEPTKGLFGILGGKAARVLVIVKDNPVEKAKAFLAGIFERMNIEKVEIEASKKEDYIVINFKGPDLGVLIGRRGDTLDALQYLVNLVANKNSKERARFILDVEGYRKRREETLGKLAFRLAEKVKRKGKDVVLEPMSPHERRIIHTALQDHKEVFTYSEGDEPFRKVIIAPKK
ncbi:RNA-binding cell elongation regulator Jag/EloR [Thermincola potens]|uniref:RNA-binding protein KhpB n=1 Tax=Thermincola potens (strain JR) TaxID=635013 RepID=D5XDU5_THEPJ|nr:RNA-binding cell elongation regulator Jag/EloR [Thermincola potens]ADG83841.1 single-stranded nucleic acid binding R3H domain protein [Thermincola potens JR]